MSVYKLFTTSVLLFLLQNSLAQTINVADVDVITGQTSSLVVKINGFSSCVAVGFSVELPNGAFKENSTDLGYVAELGKKFTASHIVKSSLHDKTILKTAIYSTDNANFKDGDDMVLLNIGFNAYDMKPGTYQGRIKDIELALNGNKLLRLPDVVFSFKVEGNTPTYIITYNDPENGFLIVAVDGEEIESGTMAEENSILTILAIPYTDYIIEGLKLNGNVISNSSSFPVTGPMNIEATFIREDENADNIKSMSSANQKECTIYNLSGQRVYRPGRGIYIKNGQKLYIR